MSQRCVSSLWAFLAVCLCCVGAKGDESSPRTINVLGSSQVQVKADLAAFEVTIRTSDPDPATAKKQNADHMQALVAAIKNLETDQVTFASRQFEVKKVNTAARFEEPKFVTECVREIEVMLNDVSRTDRLIAFLVDQNLDFNIGWQLQNEEASEHEAIEAAVKDAQQKAEKAVAILGEKLGRPLRVQAYSSTRVNSGYSSGGLFGDDEPEQSNQAIIFQRGYADITFEIVE